MKKRSSFGDDFIELEESHETKAVFKFISEMPKRGTALKRMIVWALANDLYQLVKNKIPAERRFDKLKKYLKLGEGPDNSFAVFVANKPKNIKKTDADSTLIYIKPRRIQDRIAPEIKLLSDQSPWTMDTIPFWPDRRQAVIVQRKVDRKTVEKISKLKAKLKPKIDRELSAFGTKAVESAKKNRILGMRRAKAVPDLAFEMLRLEFGDGSRRGMAIWRSSLKELFPSRVKTVLKRYKRIKDVITKKRSNDWRRWPRVDVKVKRTQLRSFIRFQKQLGY